MANNNDRWGFTTLAQLNSSLQASTVPPQTLLAELRARAAIFNRQQDAMLRIFADRVTVAQERYAIPGSGSLQPLDEQGVPRPVRPSGYVTNGYPIYGGGTAAARTRISREMETIEDIFRDTEDAEARDTIWLRGQVLSALLTKTARTFVDDIAGSITVQPLAITSDSVAYLRNSGTSSTAQHYLAQSAAISDNASPFATIYTTLSAYPGNAGRRIVVFVPTSNTAAVENLSAFLPVADPDVRAGVSSDILLPTGADLLGMGDRVLGKVNNCWAVEWSALPDDYLLAMVEGRPPLAMREYPIPARQGFFPEVYETNNGGVERRFLRYAGFGVRNRIAAMAYFVGAGDTTYDNPANFTAPMAH